MIKRGILNKMGFSVMSAPERRGGNTSTEGMGFFLAFRHLTNFGIFHLLIVYLFKIH